VTQCCYDVPEFPRTRSGSAAFCGPEEHQGAGPEPNDAEQHGDGGGGGGGRAHFNPKREQAGF
jgi:hypothetical protein